MIMLREPEEPEQLTQEQKDTLKEMGGIIDRVIEKTIEDFKQRTNREPDDAEREFIIFATVLNTVKMAKEMGLL